MSRDDDERKTRTRPEDPRYGVPVLGNVGRALPPHPTIKKRPVLGRLIDCRDGVLNIDTGSNVEKLQLEDLMDICLPDGKPMTQNKIGFDV